MNGVSQFLSSRGLGLLSPAPPRPYIRKTSRWSLAHQHNVETKHVIPQTVASIANRWLLPSQSRQITDEIAA
jgi:hypothetical protein